MILARRLSAIASIALAIGAIPLAQAPRRRDEKREPDPPPESAADRVAYRASDASIYIDDQELRGVTSVSIDIDARLVAAEAKRARKRDSRLARKGSGS